MKNDFDLGDLDQPGFSAPPVSLDTLSTLPLSALHALSSSSSSFSPTSPMSAGARGRAPKKPTAKCELAEPSQRLFRVFSVAVMAEVMDSMEWGRGAQPLKLEHSSGSNPGATLTFVQANSLQPRGRRRVGGGARASATCPRKLLRRRRVFISIVVWRQANVRLGLLADTDVPTLLSLKERKVSVVGACVPPCRSCGPKTTRHGASSLPTTRTGDGRRLGVRVAWCASPWWCRHSSPGRAASLGLRREQGELLAARVEGGVARVPDDARPQVGRQLPSLVAPYWHSDSACLHSSMRRFALQAVAIDGTKTMARFVESVAAAAPSHHYTTMPRSAKSCARSSHTRAATSTSNLPRYARTAACCRPRCTARNCASVT